MKLIVVAISMMFSLSAIATDYSWLTLNKLDHLFGITLNETSCDSVIELFGPPTKSHIVKKNNSIVLEWRGEVEAIIDCHMDSFIVFSALIRSETAQKIEVDNPGEFKEVGLFKMPMYRIKLQLGGSATVSKDIPTPHFTYKTAKGSRVTFYNDSEIKLRSISINLPEVTDTVPQSDPRPRVPRNVPPRDDSNKELKKYDDLKDEIIIDLNNFAGTGFYTKNRGGEFFDSFSYFNFRFTGKCTLEFEEHHKRERLSHPTKILYDDQKAYKIFINMMPSVIPKSITDADGKIQPYLKFKKGSLGHPPLKARYVFDNKYGQTGNVVSIDWIYLYLPSTQIVQKMSNNLFQLMGNKHCKGM